jgi:hypothetical protein
MDLGGMEESEGGHGGGCRPVTASCGGGT